MMKKSFKWLSSFLMLFLLSVQLSFATVSGPILTTGGLVPTDQAITSVTPSFTMTFQDNVYPGVGAIGLYTDTNEPLKVIQVTGNVTDVPSGTVIFNGKTVTISFKGYTFIEKKNYYVLVEGVAIKDSNGNSMITTTAFGGDNKWDFSIGDFTAPTILSTIPVDDTINVSLTSNCIINFTETVSFVPGYVQGDYDFAIYKSNGDLVSIQKPNVTIVNSTLTIDWINNLQDSTNYYVRVKGNIIQDASGNKFTGINTNTDWNFSTIRPIITDIIPPVIDSTNISSCMSTDINTINFYVTEISPISKRSGNNRSVRIYRQNVLSEVIPISDNRITINGKVVSVDVSNFIFLNNDTYTISIDAGSIKDNVDNYTTESYAQSFNTIDVPATITWKLYEWKYYFNNSHPGEVGLNKYLKLNKSGNVNYVYSNAPSNSVLEIKFNKDVDFYTDSAHFVSLHNYNPNYAADTTTDNILSDTEILNVLKVSGLKNTNLKIYSVNPTTNTIIIGFDTIQSELYSHAVLNTTASDLNVEYFGSLLSNKTYAISIDKDKISNSHNCNNRILNNETNIVTLNTSNDLPPTLTANVNQTCNTDSQEVILTFSKPVVKSAYDISWLITESLTADNLMLTPSDIASGHYLTITKVGNTTPILLKNIQVVDKQTIKFKSATKFDNNSNYIIKFNKWTVKEYVLDNPTSTLFEGYNYTFHVYDNKSPNVVSLTPSDNSINESSNRKSITIRFDEKIKTTSGYIDINREDGTSFEHINISNCIIDTLTKTMLTIPFTQHTKLEDFTSYYVTIPSGLITDTVVCANGGNIFDGFSTTIDSTQHLVSGWNFKTSDATPPELLSDGLSPKPGDKTVAKNLNLVLKFDENISIIPSNTNGFVIYYKNVDDPNDGNAIETILWNSPLITVSGSDIYNGKISDIITVNPSTTFERLGTYYIRVNGDNVKDLSVETNLWTNSTNPKLDEITDYEWMFTITEDIAPVLVSTTPAYTSGNYITLPSDSNGISFSNLSMTFEENVSRGDINKKIYLYTNNQLIREYSITDPNIVFNDKVVTINNVELFDGINGSNYYYIIVDKGAIKNSYVGSLTQWDGISNSFVWRFKTANDVVFLGHEILNPIGTNLTIDNSDELIIKFNENIKSIVNPIGKVLLISKNDTVEFTVNSSMIQNELPYGSGKITIPVNHNYLKEETDYTVKIQSGAFCDMANNVNNNITWTFSTGDYTKPTVVLTSPNDVCAKSSEFLTMTFNETNGIIKGEGNLRITGNNGFLIEKSIESAIFNNTNKNIIGFNVTGLPDNTLLTVSVPANFIKENTITKLGNNPFSWTFTTGDNTAPYIFSMTPIKAITKDTILSFTFNEEVNKVDGKFVIINGIEKDVSNFTTIDKKTYSLPLTNLITEFTYTIVIEQGSFVDINQCINNKIAETTLTFDVADITVPLVSGSPKTSGDYKGLELVFEFTDDVVPATGNVLIYNESNAIIETIPTNTLTKVDNNTYKCSPVNVRYGEYYILIDAGSFVDNTAANVGKACPGISDKTAWTLSIIDNKFECESPNIISPERGATNVSLSTNIIIDFCNERIVPGNGIITIADQSIDRELGVNYFEYSVTSNMISGNKLTVPVTGLKENTTYSIIINYDAVEDEAGNEFISNILDANYWIFTTGDFTTPVVNVDAVTVFNNETGFVTVSCNEPVIIYLAKDNVNVSIISLEDAINTNTAVKDTLSIAGGLSLSATGLVPGTYKVYGIDAAGNIGIATNVVTIEEIVPINIYTIAQIQGDTETSPLVGKTVRTKGTVTCMTNVGYYIQDEVTELSGIYVLSNENVGIGSSVDIIGTVTEINGITTINNVTETKYISPVVNPVSIKISAISEKYESELVYVTGRANESNTVTESWTAGNYTIDNVLYGSYKTMKDYNYGIKGIVANNKIIAIEIENLSQTNGKDDLLNKIEIYPNPFNDYITIHSNVNITNAIITNTTGQIVKKVINVNNIPTNDLRSGVYFISLFNNSGLIRTDKIIKK